MHTTLNTRKRGVSLLYSSVIMVGLFGITSLAVDWGRVQVAKSQMRAAVDAASRNAAMLLPNGPSAAVAGARAAASENVVDGSSLVLNQAEDIELGNWNTSTRKFTKLSNSNLANANAVRVIGRRTAARGNAVPTIFAQILGQKSFDVQAESISMLISPQVIDTTVPATATPYLAGMPNGTISSANNPEGPGDRAPYQSPPQVAMSIKPGEALAFDNIEGGANNNYTWEERFNPDGNTSWLVKNWSGRSGGNDMAPEHGKSNLHAPINALVGVFLTDELPANAKAPAALDFSNASDRNFEKLEPKIGQVFFIGDGKRDSGEPQRFIVPEGATRFYLANWDGYNWSNNVGVRTTRTTRLGSVVTVK